MSALERVLLQRMQYGSIQPGLGKGVHLSIVSRVPLLTMTLERYLPFNTGVFAWREFTVDSKLYCLNMEITF